MHVAVNCNEAPLAPVNSKRTGTSTTFNSTVTYTCNQGYSLSAQRLQNRKTSITCMANGQWSGSVPQCES